MIVLFTMPLGHSLMILMEHLFDKSLLHYIAFFMGFLGLIFTIIGIFASNDTRQTLWGLFGGLLFWTGWIEFTYVYYAHRFGVQPLIIDGQIVTKPEYLLMPSSFGFLAMIMFFYFFSIRTGCNALNYLQKVFLSKNKIRMKVKPAVRHTSIVTFMELNLLLWASYLLLLFCYDEEFIGDRSPITAIVAFGCLFGSLYMFYKLLQIRQWGHSIRYAIPTVIVFWTFVEVMGRWNFLHEIWVHPLDYKMEILGILGGFVALTLLIVWNSKKRKREAR